MVYQVNEEAQKAPDCDAMRQLQRSNIAASAYIRGDRRHCFDARRSSWREGNSCARFLNEPQMRTSSFATCGRDSLEFHRRLCVIYRVHSITATSEWPIMIRSAWTFLFLCHAFISPCSFALSSFTAYPSIFAVRSTKTRLCLSLLWLSVVCACRVITQDFI